MAAKGGKGSTILLVVVLVAVALCLIGWAANGFN